MTDVEILFRERDHTYWREDRRIPGVSDILAFSGDSPDEIVYASDPEAARRGTLVHRMTEAIDRGESVVAEDWLEGYVDAYRRFLMEIRPVWHGAEVRRWHPVYRFAGTLDRVGLIGARPVILDIKTGKSSAPWHGRQLAAYELLWRLTNPLPRERVNLHLLKDGTWRLAPKTDPSDHDRFRQMLNRWRRDHE
jgi:hypothetical protein